MLVLEFTGSEDDASEERNVLWRLTGYLIIGLIGPPVAIDDTAWNNGHNLHL
ncbi:hypothetical protein ACWEPL_26545 [Nonomuraea sp. NPDC004186]